MKSNIYPLDERASIRSFFFFFQFFNNFIIPFEKSMFFGFKLNDTFDQKIK